MLTVCTLFYDVNVLRYSAVKFGCDGRTHLLAATTAVPGELLAAKLGVGNHNNGSGGANPVIVVAAARKLPAEDVALCVLTFEPSSDAALASLSIDAELYAAGNTGWGLKSDADRCTSRELMPKDGTKRSLVVGAGAALAGGGAGSETLRGFTSLAYDVIHGHTVIFYGTATGKVYGVVVDAGVDGGRSEAESARNVFFVGNASTTAAELSTNVGGGGGGGGGGSGGTNQASRRVTSLSVVPDRNVIVALTSTRATKIQLDAVCGAHSSCSGCVSAGPYCGWCVLSRDCTARAACSTLDRVVEREQSNDSLFWLQTLGSSDPLAAAATPESTCPAITASLPNAFSVGSATDVELFVQALPELPSAEPSASDAYYCVIKGYATVRAEHNPSAGTMLCPGILVAALASTDQFEANVSLSVFYGNAGSGAPGSTGNGLVEVAGNLATNMVTVFECGALAASEGCTSCLSAGAYGRCTWCPYQTSCVARDQRGLSSCIAEVTQNDTCPSVDTTLQVELDLANPEQREFVHIMGSNLPKVYNAGEVHEYTCEITDATGIRRALSFPASLLSDTEVRCALTSALWEDALNSVDAKSGVIQRDLSLLINGGRLVAGEAGLLPITMFSCDALSKNDNNGADCGRCVRSESVRFGCGWCDEGREAQTCTTQVACGVSMVRTELSDCPRPTVISFYPPAGPVHGGTEVELVGTNLGRSLADILWVGLVGQEDCEILSFDPKAGSLRVRTKPSYRREPDSTKFTVALNVSVKSVQAYSRGSFQYAVPSVSAVSPRKTPVSGGSTVVLTGSHLNVGLNHAVEVGASRCVGLTFNAGGTQANCTTLPVQNISAAYRNSIANDSSRVCYQIDGMVGLDLCAAIDDGGAVGFRTVDDPVVVSVSPLNVPVAGGVILAADGSSLNAAIAPTMRVNFSTTEMARVSDCSYNAAGTQLECVLPPFPSGGGQIQSGESQSTVVRFVFDGAYADQVIEYHPNPSVDAVAPLAGTEDAVIQIYGTGLLNAGVPTVRIGSEVARLSGTPSQESMFVIVPPNAGSRPEATISITLGTWEFVNDAPFRYTEEGDTYRSFGNNNTIVVQSGIGNSVAGGVIGGLVLAGVLYYIVNRIYQKRALDDVLSRMNTLESQVVEVCKQGFAELQNDKSFALDGNESLPQREYADFMSTVLFTRKDTHPVPGAIVGPGYSEPIKTFRRLLGSTQFVVGFVSALEEAGEGFPIPDRCHVAALLQLALHEDPGYGYEVLTALLDVLFSRPSTAKHPKLALRRTEWVAEKYLTSWLSSQLQPYVTEHVARPFFELLHALEVQAGKGPVDCKTGASMYTLNGDNLLRERIPFEQISITVTVPLGTSKDPSVVLEINDVDTPTQVVTKVARRLGQEMDIVPAKWALVESGWPDSGRHLCDLEEGSLCDHEYQLVQINTIKYFAISPGAQLQLIPMEKMNIAPELAPKARRRFSTGFSKQANYLTYTQWHLVKPSEHGSVDTIPSEVFLTYMLTVKGIVQPYVQAFINAVFSNEHIPVAVSAICNYIDATVAELGITDPEVAHVWKNNALPLRFFVNLVKNPNFVFDAETSPSVSSNMTVIAQVIMDACSVSEQHLSHNSPANKLLYRADVRTFKDVVKAFYKAGSATGNAKFVPPLQIQDPKVSADSAAFELLRFVAPHKDRIAGALLTRGKGAMAAEFSQCCGAADDGVVRRRRAKGPAARTGTMSHQNSMFIGAADLQSGYLQIAGDRSSITIDSELFVEPPSPAILQATDRPSSVYGGFGDTNFDGVIPGVGEEVGV